MKKMIIILTLTAATLFSGFFTSASAKMECGDISRNSYDYEEVKKYKKSEQCAEGSECFISPNGVHITCTEVAIQYPYWAE